MRHGGPCASTALERGRLGLPFFVGSASGIGVFLLPSEPYGATAINQSGATQAAGERNSSVLQAASSGCSP